MKQDSQPYILIHSCETGFTDSAPYTQTHYQQSPVGYTIVDRTGGPYTGRHATSNAHMGRQIIEDYGLTTHWHTHYQACPGGGHIIEDDELTTHCKHTTSKCPCLETIVEIKVGHTLADTLPAKPKSGISLWSHRRTIHWQTCSQPCLGESTHH